MITEFVERFMAKKSTLETMFSDKHPENYYEIVEAVVSIITSDDEYGDIDPSRIHKIDDGNYQGTLLYVIPERGYQPHDYWYVKVGYGSCCGCDTLEGIVYSECSDEQKVKDYMTLALHIVQGIKKMD